MKLVLMNWTEEDTHFRIWVRSFSEGGNLSLVGLEQRSSNGDWHLCKLRETLSSLIMDCGVCLRGMEKINTQREMRESEQKLAAANMIAGKSTGPAFL